MCHGITAEAEEGAAGADDLGGAGPVEGVGDGLGGGVGVRDGAAGEVAARERGVCQVPEEVLVLEVAL